MNCPLDGEAYVGIVRSIFTICNRRYERRLDLGRQLWIHQQLASGGSRRTDLVERFLPSLPGQDLAPC